jgi:hypothetical protein
MELKNDNFTVRNQRHSAPNACSRPAVDRFFLAKIFLRLGGTRRTRTVCLLRSSQNVSKICTSVLLQSSKIWFVFCYELCPAPRCQLTNTPTDSSEARWMQKRTTVAARLLEFGAEVESASRYKIERD